MNISYLASNSKYIYIFSMEEHIIKKEEMIKNSKNVFIIKPIQNRLKIDSYKPTMMKPLVMISNQTKDIRSRSKRRQLSLPNKPESNLTSANSTINSKMYERIPQLKTIESQYQKNKENVQNDTHYRRKSHQKIKQNKQNHFTKKQSRESVKQQPEQAEANPFDFGNMQKQMEQLKNYFEDIMSFMVKKYMLTINAGFVKLKKDKMLCLMMSLSRIMLNINEDDCNNNSCQTPPPPEMASIFKKISKLTSALIHDRKINKLKIHNQTVKRLILVNDLDKQTQNVTKKLSDMFQQQDQLKVNIEKLKEEAKLRQQVCQSIKFEVVKAEQKLYDAKKQHDQLIKQSESIRLEIDNLKKKLEDAQEKGNDVFLFVQRQKKRPFLNKVSLDYKHMESVMFDYAYEMTCRAQMHLFQWEPQPFEAIEKFLTSDINRTLDIIKSDKYKLEQKNKEMKQLVLRIVRHMKVKDREMSEVVKKKTAAINRFVDIMRQWNEEHCMKNQYLGTMRKQYAVDAAIVEECICNFEKSELNEEQKKWMPQLKQNWEWVNLAFLYGNSFY